MFIILEKLNENSENKEKIYEFLVSLRSKPILRLNSKQLFAKKFFSFFRDQKDYESYFHFCKKQFQN